MLAPVAVGAGVGVAHPVAPGGVPVELGPALAGDADPVVAELAMFAGKVEVWLLGEDGLPCCR